MRARLSFVVVMSVLLAAFFRPEGKKNRIGSETIAIILFVGFYLFDIHTADLGARQDHIKPTLDTTLVVLSIPK